ncbi:MAG: hypothetical protein FJ288_19655 [Planctomycetes bacterium]|nr:hypothetical protein [Planctomycetota bacterium]
MGNQPDEKPAAGGAARAAGTELARILAVLGVNLIVVLLAVVLTSTDRGRLPDLDVRTLAVEFLPVSAAAGLMLSCRRLDLALPAVLALAIAMRGNPWVLSSDPTVRLATVAGIAAGIGLLSALATWMGRISSALWTGLLAVGLWMFARELHSVLASAGPWPWPAALAASLGALAAGAAVLGLAGLVSLPSTPPIWRTGSQGLAGLIGAWMAAGIGLALAAQSEIARPMSKDPLAPYPAMLAAGALGGGYILRGRWGAVAAVLLTCVGHLVWSFILSTDLGSTTANLAMPAAAPLAAVPLFLAIDWAIRRSTSESAPTGLLA